MPRIFGARAQVLEFLDAQHLWELRPSRPWGEVEVEDIPTGDLNDIKIRNMCAFGHHHRMTDREAAIALIDSVVARKGAAEVLDVINAAPVLNG